MSQQLFERDRRGRTRTILRNKPTRPDHIGQRNGNPATHGGAVSFGLFAFLSESPRLMNLLAPEMQRHTYIDMGSASGRTCMIVSGRSTNGRNVIGIEFDQERHDLGQQWIDNVMEEFGEYTFPTRHMLPFLFRADFTDPPIPALAHALAHRQIVFFCNNYGTTWSGETQIGMESRIRDAKSGSILISFTRSFLTDFSWHEEVFTTSVARHHVSWFSRAANQERQEPLPIYKYTKRDYAGPYRSRSEIPTAVFLPFPRSYNHWPRL